MSYSMERGTPTPWGKADKVWDVRRGVWVIKTPTHGGIAVHKELTAALSPAAAHRAQVLGDYLFYERDYDWAIPVFDLRLYTDIQLVWPEVSRERVLRTLQQWHGDYLYQVAPGLFQLTERRVRPA